MDDLSAQALLDWAQQMLEEQLPRVARLQAKMSQQWEWIASVQEQLWMQDALRLHDPPIADEPSHPPS